MTCYIISYDLLKPRQNYNELYEAIKSYGTWAHINESVWAVVTDQKPLDILNNLRKYLDGKDRIFVVKSGYEASWVNVLCKTEWLQKNL